MSSASMSGPESPIVVFCATDDAFALPAAVMLSSCLRNYRGSARIEVRILDGGVTAANKHRIERVLSPFDVHAKWESLNLHLVADLPTSGRISASAYSRLWIPELLPEGTTRAIYLDCDMLVEGCIGELWKQEIGDACFLAATNPGRKALLSEYDVGGCPDVVYSADQAAFNSGVLLMHVPRMREHRLADRAFDFARKWPQFVRREQDEGALNAVSVGKWGKLDPKWNQLVSNKKDQPFRRREDGILHFVGRVKPWIPSKTIPDQEDDVGLAHRLYAQHLQTSGIFGPMAATRQRLVTLVSRRIRRWRPLISGGLRAFSRR